MAKGVFFEDVNGQKALIQEIKDEASIGSSRNADVQLDDIRCGGIHALIERVDGTDDYVILDLGSRSGTFVDGKRVAETTLEPGQFFTIGQHRLFIREVDTESAPQRISPSFKPDRKKFKPIADASHVPDINEKTVLQVALFWGEQILDIRTFEPGTDITIGPQKEATFGVTLANADHMQAPYRIAHFSRDQLKLHIPQEAAGLVWVGNETISLDSLRHEDKSANKVTDINVPLKVGDRADIHFGELTLSFRFVTPAVEPPRRIFFYLDRVFLKVLLGLCLVYILFFLWLIMGDASKPRAKTIASLPKHMQRVIFDVGIEKALKRQQAAIGQIAKQLEGGRARAEEGQAKTKKSPQKNQEVKTAEKKNQESKQEKQSQTEMEKQEPVVDIESAFSSSKKSSTTESPTRVTGREQDGNTATALATSSYSRGKFGQGPGGGGTSVGIGALKGNLTGGGLGASDYGLDPSKGREINIPQDEELQILGGLDPDIIARYIKGYLNQIRNCYEQRLQVRPTLKGKVKVSFIIRGDGGVKAVRIIESSLADPPTHQCISKRISEWTFPKPQGGGTVGVKYPFLLMSNTGS